MAHSRRDKQGLHGGGMFGKIVLLMNGHEDARIEMWIWVVCCKWRVLSGNRVRVEAS